MEHMSSPVRFRNSKKAAAFSQMEVSSLSIEDQEDNQFPYAMRDLPPASQLSDHRQRKPDHQEPVDQAPDRSRTPLREGLPSSSRTSSLPRHFCGQPAGSPTVPPRALMKASQSSTSRSSSPASRPQSPWCFFEIYDTPEDQDKEYVGFATLPNQVHRKTVKKGFTFTLMVAGETGLGKSTLIKSLFLTDLYRERKVPKAQEQIKQTVNVVKHTVGIQEKGIKLRLTIVDTPGFGDAVNNTKCWQRLEDYIDQQFEQYFRDESGLNRRNIQDNRVHCCLYFISPFSHGLRPLDVECMKGLSDKVNIVPVLAKADCLTPAEMQRKKQRIKQEIKQFGINIYQLPDCDSDEDEDFKRQDQIMKDSLPFAVIGSDVQVESKGRKVRGRSYPWGVVEVEDPVHSDFLLLRNMLVMTYMEDLKEVTQETHYENYRAKYIHKMSQMVVQDSKRSLLERHQDSSKASLPLPPSSADSERERRIHEQDEAARFRRAARLQR